MTDDDDKEIDINLWLDESLLAECQRRAAEGGLSLDDWIVRAAMRRLAEQHLTPDDLPAKVELCGGPRDGEVREWPDDDDRTSLIEVDGDQYQLRIDHANKLRASEGLPLLVDLVRD